MPAKRATRIRGGLPPQNSSLIIFVTFTPNPGSFPVVTKLCLHSLQPPSVIVFNYSRQIQSTQPPVTDGSHVENCHDIGSPTLCRGELDTGVLSSFVEFCQVVLSGGFIRWF